MGGKPKRGSSGRTRTCDKSVNSRLLYQLSYRGSATLKDGGYRLGGGRDQACADLTRKKGSAEAEP